MTFCWSFISNFSWAFFVLRPRPKPQNRDRDRKTETETETETETLFLMGPASFYPRTSRRTLIRGIILPFTSTGLDLCYLVLSCLVLCPLASPCLVLSCAVLSRLVSSCLVLLCGGPVIVTCLPSPCVVFCCVLQPCLALPSLSLPGIVLS